MSDEILALCLNKENYVVQANDMISGRQNLSLNSSKLIRVAIMNVVRDDEELKDYKVSAGDLAKLLEIPASDIRRDARTIINDIIKNPLEIKQVSKNKERFIAIPWVKYLEYDSENGFTIKLNDLLKPYLLNLKHHYTQYTLDNIIKLKSVYAIRIFELLEKKHIGKIIPMDGVYIELTLKEIKEACACPSSYDKFSNLKNYVLDISVKEINEKTMYHLEYSYVKKGRSVVAIRFLMNTRLHKNIIDNGWRDQAEQVAERMKERISEGRQ